MSKVNRYTRAMRQLKSTALTEAPTNSMQGIYVDTPFTFTPQPPEKFNISVADFDQDASPDGKDTTGLFYEDGTIKVAEPTGDTSYILGPMASMWYAWGNFSTFGYIRQSDRKMVNLGKITGKLSDWDQTDTDFTSYGQLTLEQAKWFYNIDKYNAAGNDPANANYRAFYPGPPSNTPDAQGRYYCTITGAPKGNDNVVPPIPDHQPGDKFNRGTNVGSDDENSPLKNIVPGSANPDNKGKGWLSKVKDSIGDAWDKISDSVEGTTWGKLGGSVLRSIMDPITYAGDIIFKGLPEGVPYKPDFKGAGPKWAGGKKITDMLGGLFGKDVQYFTPDLDTAIKYAGEGGSVVAMPRPKTGVQGMKNWLGSTVSRGFDPTKGVEQIVKTSDSVAAANLTKVVNLSDEGSAATLKALAAKGATTNKVLSKLGKAVPFLNAGLVAADVTNRISKGDYAGALLGGLQIIPGPVGWVALGSQLAYDVSGSKKNIPWNKSVSEAVDDSSMSGNMGTALIEMGLPKDKKEFIKEMGFYLMLQDQIDPNILSMLLKALQGEELSSEQKKWMDQNFESMINAVANRNKGDAKESFYTPKTRKLLREIKQPYVMPEEKKVKLTGYKPKLPSKMHQLADSMNDLPRVTFAKAETGSWKAGDLARGTKMSQEKKNQVLELLGQGEDSWKYMTETSRKKSAKAMYENFTLMNEQGEGTYKINRKEPLRSDFVLFLEYEDGTKSTMLQSELNEKMADQSEKWRKDWKEPVKYEDQPAYKKVKKILSKEIPMKDIQPEFPKKAPPKLDPETQMHPDMFKRHDYFTKLDPESAKSMAAAPTGDPQIDSEVEKAKKKSK